MSLNQAQADPATVTTMALISHRDLAALRASLAAAQAEAAQWQADANELGARVRELEQLIYQYSVADNVPLLVRNAVALAATTTDAHTAAILAGWLGCLPPHRFDESPDRPEPPRQADAARWQGKYAELREIVLLVEDFADNRDQETMMALVDAFCAFRALVEGGTPRTWLVGAPGGAGAGAGEAPWGEVIDEWEAPHSAVGAGDVPWA